MRKMIRVLFLGLLGLSSTFLQAQAGTLPAASTTANTIPWTLPSNCTTVNTCQFQVYRCQGVCTVASTGWTLLGTTVTQAISYVDSTPSGGVQYSYDVEAVPTGSTTAFSGPSNIGQVTTVFTPLPPVIGTITSV
jgi:hypothetical protein